MGQDRSLGLGRPSFAAVIVFVVLAWAAPLRAEEEINWDSGQPAAQAAPTAAPATEAAAPAAGQDLQEAESAAMTPVATPMATPLGTPAPLAQAAASPVPTAAPEDPAAPKEVSGVLKMKDVYELGMKSYKQDDYVQAIRYLKQALTLHDPYTPSFYYAEDNAMLGVIYQFHIVHPDLAYQYYHEALRIDPTTETAKKHIDEVKPGQN